MSSLWKSDLLSSIWRVMRTLHSVKNFRRLMILVFQETAVFIMEELKRKSFSLNLFTSFFTLYAFLILGKFMCVYRCFSWRRIVIQNENFIFDRLKHPSTCPDWRTLEKRQLGVSTRFIHHSRFRPVLYEYITNP